MLSTKFTLNTSPKLSYLFCEKIFNRRDERVPYKKKLLTTVFLRFFLKNYKKKLFASNLHIAPKITSPFFAFTLHLLRQTAILLSPWKLFKKSSQQSKFVFSSKFYVLKRNIRIKQLTWDFLNKQLIANIKKKSTAKFSKDIYKTLEKDRLRLQRVAANPRLRLKDLNKLGALTYLMLILLLLSEKNVFLSSKSKVIAAYASAVNTIASASIACF